MRTDLRLKSADLGAYKTEADRNQGDAEIAILKLQKSLPPMPHLTTLPIRYKGETVGTLIAAKSKGENFTHMGNEFLSGICHMLEAIYESAALDTLKPLKPSWSAEKRVFTASKVVFVVSDFSVSR